MQEKKILIVDGDPVASEQMAATCRNFNFKVGITTQGQDLTDRLRESKPDLVILSVQLPDQNGFVLCKQVKADAQLSKIPLILVSQQDDAPAFEKHRTLKDAANGYLLKPIDPHDLIDQIEELIGLPPPPSSKKEVISPADFQALQKRFDDLQVEFSDLRRERDLAQKSLDSKDREINIVRESFESVSHKLEKAKAETARRDEQIEEVEQRVMDLQHDHAQEMEALKKDLLHALQEKDQLMEALQEDLKGLQLQFEGLEQERQDLAEQLELVARRSKISEEENQQRENNLKQRIKDLLATVDDERQAQDDLKQQMESLQRGHFEQLEQIKAEFGQLEDEKIKMEQRVVKAYKKIKLDQVRDEKIQKAVEIVLTLLKSSS